MGNPSQVRAKDERGNEVFFVNDIYAEPIGRVEEFNLYIVTMVGGGERLMLEDTIKETKTIF
jgi:hypothetical protein